MSALPDFLESAERFPGAPRPQPDEMSRFERERDAAVDLVSERLGPLATEAVRSALHAAYTFGRFDATRYATQVRK